MYKDLIINVCKDNGLLRNEAAYVLATTEWETNRTFEPVKEAYWLSENWRKSNLRYYPWYGRGFVQLTWETNYIKAGQKLGLDLTTNPDRVMDPSVAAQILVRGMKEGWFTGKKLSDYIDLQRSDFYNARRIVNGLDKAKEIEALAKKYNKELLKAGYGVSKPPLNSPQKPVQRGKDKGEGVGIGAAVLAILGAIVAFVLNQLGVV